MTPSISWEQFEIGTLNMPCRLTARDTNDKNEKLGQSGVGKGSLPTFEILGSPSYLGNGLWQAVVPRPTQIVHLWAGKMKLSNTK